MKYIFIILFSTISMAQTIGNFILVQKKGTMIVGENGAILQWGNGVVNPVENNQTKSIKLPSELKLLRNYPNPFNPTTIIIYDAFGREVANLVNEEKSAGNYTTEFSAANLSSGIYFYQIRVGEFIQTKRWCC